MYPILLDWNGLVLPAWHTMFALGALATWGVMVFLRPRALPAVSLSVLSELFLAGYVAGYFGARLMSVIIDENGGGSVLGFLQLLLTPGPMTFYGGALATGLVGWAVATYRRVPKRRLMDITLAGCLIALALGRVGCFLNGCDYGCPAPVSGDGAPPWWSHINRVLGDEVARFPTQLSEAFFALILGGLLIWVIATRYERFRPGVLGYLGIAAYAIFRFINEFFRCDARGWVLEGILSPAQAIGAGVLLFLIVTFPLIRKEEIP
jgi:phosphatidylglycerol:prolipoprotein diacylglycerol transferase